MIAKHYGRSYTLQSLREKSFIKREGVSMLGISDAAESIGMHTQGVRITLEQLVEDVPLPCILHWNQNHFVVLYRCTPSNSPKGRGFFPPLRGARGTTTGLLISFLSAKAVVEGQITLGMMMSISYIIGQLSGPIGQVIGFAQSLQDAKISLERLNEIHNKEDEEQTIEGKINSIPDNKTARLENVCFSYDGAERDYVLENLDLEIPQNKVTAIVGASGSGKTTIIKLLLGFYTPLKGKITIDNIPLDEINPHLWRQQCGAVMQDGFIFSDTIANNIAVGEEEIDKKRLLYAVETANIREFIESLPLKYNTKIGMDGKGISQGQRQRLLIARAVYKNPEFLFFDEATNSLDANNERIIMDNLTAFYKGKTVVIVAHRLSTVQHADNIIVLEKGKVIEEGTHRELTEKRGAYYTLVKNQLELGS
jgi:ATP-binding cassette subfamily B protein